MIARRAGAIGMLLALAASLVVMATGRAADAFVLTVTAAAGIINTFWLERALDRLLQPWKARISRAAVVLLVARLVVWSVLFGVLYLLRRQVDMWAVAAGVVCYMAALLFAGLGAGSEMPRGD